MKDIYSILCAFFLQQKNLNLFYDSHNRLMFSGFVQSTDSQMVCKFTQTLCCKKFTTINQKQFQKLVEVRPCMKIK